MLEKLIGLKEKYMQVQERLVQPETIANQTLWLELTKEYAALSPIIEKYDAYEAAKNACADYKDMLMEANEQEMKELIRQELADQQAALEKLQSELKVLLLPKDPNDDKDVIIEVRAGIGGEEAALFGADLLRMYLRYAERNGYRVEFLTNNVTDMGGVKEVIISLGGKRGAYSRLKYESGVHRVQRVPETESQGRIQTSAATVAVLPEVEDVDVEIQDGDLRIDTFRSSGAGGQHVNKTESAIRITHLPTGIVVSCQDEKSQIKNKEKAMRVLKSRLYDHFQSAQAAELATVRRNLVGSGDRSERIRTYNFPQNRVTDHRIGVTLYKLEQFIDGDMDEMIDQLILADRTAQLSAVQE